MFHIPQELTPLYNVVTVSASILAVIHAPKTRSARAPAVVAGLLLVLALQACSADAPLNFLHPEGEVARLADDLWKLTFGIASAVFVLVEGLILFAIFRFRERSVHALPKQTHGNNKAEIAWTIAPTLLLLGIAVPTVAGIYRVAEPPDGNRLDVKVTAHQWWWEIEYPNEKVITAGELHIPVDRAVYVALESADVIHSFWVPKLAGKQDVVPGRTNYLTLKADVAKEYLGQCVEFCGLSHANMQFRVFAHSPRDFERWITEQKIAAGSPSSALAVSGEKLFLDGQCATCHTINGTKAGGRVGPDLTHMASRTRFAGSMFERNDDNLRAWLRDPPGRKPGSKMPKLGLTDDEIEALVAYLNTLT